MSTANDLITMALRDLNVIGSDETASATDVDACLSKLNFMLDKWNNEKLMLHYHLRTTKTLTASTASYTIGSGGNIDIAAPLKIESAFIRDTGGNDGPLAIISDAEYNAVVDKDLTGMPEKLYYCPKYATGLGTIYLYPSPDAAYTLGISTLSPLAQMTLSATIYLPNGYLYAIVENLKLEIAPMFGKQIPDIMFKNAADAKHNLQDTNERPAELNCSVDIGSSDSFNIDTGF